MQGMSGLRCAFASEQLSCRWRVTVMCKHIADACGDAAPILWLVFMPRPGSIAQP